MPPRTRCVPPAAGRNVVSDRTSCVSQLSCTVTAKSAGKFDDYTKNCPSFSPELCKFIPAGLAEYRRFTKQDRNEAPSSPPGAAAVNTLTAAA